MNHAWAEYFRSNLDWGWDISQSLNAMFSQQIPFPSKVTGEFIEDTEEV